LKEFLINENIKNEELIVIDNNNNNLGTIPLSKALFLADDLNLDLVLISEKPAVAKIIDYNKFIFNESKKDKKQHSIPNKEVQFSITIDKHDLFIKINKIKLFLTKKHNVLIKIKFKGRQLQHKELGFSLLEDILKELQDLFKTDKKPELNGKTLTFFIQPK
jgi:translation initiation factor IF-3